MKKTSKTMSYVSDFLKRADLVLLGLCCLCTIFGIILISSAVQSYADNPAYGSPAKFIIVQCAAFIMGIGLFVVFTVLDIDILADKWPVLLIGSVVFMCTLLVWGQSGDTGNTGWLRFFGIGIQPSEVVKIAFIIMMAKHISYLREYRDLNSIISVAQLVVHFGFMFVLVIVTSEDLGSAMVFFAIFLVMVFVAGLKPHWFLIGVAAIAAVTPILWSNFLKPYQRDRIIAPYYHDPNVPGSVDPQGWEIRWQPVRSKLALASGQATGVGLGQGVQSQSDALTNKHTDFIFAVAGEELGMVGCTLIILLLLAVIFRCVQVGLRSRNTLSMLVCFGVAGMLFFQTFENIGMCMELTPVIGITLPFFSYGGSSLFCSFAAVGLVSGVKYRPKPELFRIYG